MRSSASWVIDSKPIRARGIIVKNRFITSLLLHNYNCSNSVVTSNIFYYSIYKIRVVLILLNVFEGQFYSLCLFSNLFPFCLSLLAYRQKALCYRRLEWMNEWMNDGNVFSIILEHAVTRDLQGRHTRGILLPEHAPGALSGSKAPPCVPTISWVYFILGSSISTPQNTPRYLTG